MRDALADGGLLAFIKAPNGQMELLVDRESWRQNLLAFLALKTCPMTSQIQDHIPAVSRSF